MRQINKSLLVLNLIAGLPCATALADGGQVRVMERRGDYRITVFTAPNPLRAGPVDVSVFVQDAASGEAAPMGDITIDLTPRDGSHPTIRSAATTFDATNKLFRAASVELPSPGIWGVRVECVSALSGKHATVQFEMEAGPPLPRWLAVWPWFAWPAMVVLLFAAHRLLVAHRQTSSFVRSTRELRQIPKAVGS